jgi:transposase
MIGGISTEQVYLASGFTDMRKSINGLSIIVSEQLDFNPYNGSVFVFCNRGRDKLKILYWEHNGFWLAYRRLDKGKFKWPTQSDSDVISLSLRELQWLLAGLSFVQKQAHTRINGLTNN